MKIKSASYNSFDFVFLSLREREPRGGGEVAAAEEIQNPGGVFVRAVGVDAQAAVRKHAELESHERRAAPA